MAPATIQPRNHGKELKVLERFAQNSRLKNWVIEVFSIREASDSPTAAVHVTLDVLLAEPSVTP